MILASIGGLAADDEAGPKTIPTKAVFKPSLSTIKELEPYSKTPDEESSLPGTSYPVVVGAFDQCLRRVLKPAFVPDRKFIDENIRLVPATMGNGREDVVFLSYGIEKKTILVVMTAGREGYMRIFFDDPGQKKLQTTGDAAERARTVLAGHFLDVVGKRLSPLVTPSSLKENGGTFLVEMKQADRPRPKADSPPWFAGDARLFIGDSGICLCASNAFVWQGRPARDRQPNEWFERTKEAMTPGRKAVEEKPSVPRELP
jgi:hypothetical protein